MYFVFNFYIHLQSKTKTNKMKVTKGQKFEITRTTPFGKTINEIVTVVAIIRNTVMMDNGREYHLSQF